MACTDSEGDATMPSLPISHPSLKLVLTQPSLTFTPAAVVALNDPSVYMNLNGPPYPYTDSDASAWFEILTRQGFEAIEQLKAMTAEQKDRPADFADNDWRRKKWVSAGLPYTTIAIDETDGPRFVGEITVRRSEFPWELDESLRKTCKEINDKRGAGDPETVWEVGYYLTPAFHGQGIMPRVLCTVIEEFMVPCMNAQVIYGTYFDFNVSSRKVMEKCGFEYVMLRPDLVELKKSKTGVEGKRCGLGVMQWKKP